MAQSASKRSVHLVGSVPLASADEVFQTTAEILGDRVARLPDGETGHRRNWVGFQYAMLARHPQFEFAGPPVDPDILSNESDGEGADYSMPTPIKPRAGVSADAIDFPSLGYADNARESYRSFAALKKAGKIHAGARMLVALPTPLATIAMFVVPEHMFGVLPAYGRALFGEAQQIAAAIPHRELAIQWDVAVEFGLWEGMFPPPPGDWKPMILGQLADLSKAVPADVELGYHLCYGDRGHHHFIEPKDMANLVEVANGISARVQRPVQWIHMPVPRNRTDPAFFAALKDLKLKPETELFLGLVHRSDGVEGTRKRIEAAKTAVAKFGIGAECGMGRRNPGTIREFLAIHRDAAG